MFRPTLPPALRLLAPALALLALLLAACSAMPHKQVDTIGEYGNAVRWSDWDTAWQFTDPSSRKTLQLPVEVQDRMHDIKVTGYTVRTSEAQPDGSVVQLVEIHYVDEKTQVEHMLRVHENWVTYDKGVHFWITSGLPEF